MGSAEGAAEWAKSEDTKRIFTPRGEIAQVVAGVKKNRPRWQGNRGVILSEVPRFFFRAVSARRGTQSKDLSSIYESRNRAIRERFSDCVSRRLAQNQNRKTPRSE